MDCSITISSDFKIIKSNVAHKIRAVCPYMDCLKGFCVNL